MKVAQLAVNRWGPSVVAYVGGHWVHSSGAPAATAAGGSGTAAAATSGGASTAAAETPTVGRNGIDPIADPTITVLGDAAAETSTVESNGVALKPPEQEAPPQDSITLEGTSCMVHRRGR